ncbi:hypothetical protein EES45_33745 [Streptomyces sp. ADI97-07]|uniref:hypothetical protein n=1 Tax=Streptomyces sp. ADI97-07 TaxID=1522762 RepID=UPI000FA775DC|nr:hypothetical protein [Streptomyces sp. ADI97-07]RPK72042.1 hypothetical protein EES45_33745 [Streptomyces sp. ADI97-07]
MAFQEHVERVADDVVGEFPPDGGIYAVTFRIDSVDQDPRWPYVAVGYTTEADAAEEAERLSDSWESRWSYACFPETGLEGVRLVGRDPEGVELHRREAESRGLWYEDDDEPDNYDSRLVEWFYEVCVRAAQRLHESGGGAGSAGPRDSVRHVRSGCDVPVDRGRQCGGADRGVHGRGPGWTARAPKA